ncbi:hypothetical protein [Falsibacillus albus]|uniref:Uncharacterized protein n=1 Tax=Falsibacillus albus TaxID=2478915 RepID=A0A3L7JR64_9BACI|nr:hypothetical protein [Falsibacillus albus]RLQ93303.1 hypothetical protein D9X91_17725 [Falsibacillus albus]
MSDGIDHVISCKNCRRILPWSQMPQHKGILRAEVVNINEYGKALLKVTCHQCQFDNIFYSLLDSK